MKQTNKFLLMLVFLLSLWQAKAQVLPPATYTTVSVGNQTLTSVSASDTSNWYQWTNDSAQVAISLKMNANGLQKKLTYMNLYVVNNDTLYILAHDSLRLDSTMFVYTKGLDIGSTLFLEVKTLTISCTGCTPAYPSTTLKFIQQTGCTPYTQPNCQLVKDGGMEYNPYNPCSSLILGMMPCYWSWPAFSGSSPGTSDFFASCAPITSFPNNTSAGAAFNVYSNGASGITSVAPNNGSAYCGALLANSGYSVQGCQQANHNYREYLVNKLNTPMLAGVTYSIGMWVRLAPVSKFATSNIHMGFSAGLPGQPSQGGVGVNISSIAFTSFTNSAVTDKTQWTYLSKTYTPATTYSYITLGNFYDFSTTSVTDLDIYNTWNYGQQLTYNMGVSYYYFDDVSITPMGPSAGTGTTSCGPITYTLGNSANAPATYTWSANPADPTLTATHSPTPVVTPTVTTVYTMSTSCGVNTVTITILPNFTLTAAASPTYVCPGSTSTLTASGATSYTWLPVAAGLPSGSGSPTVVITPSANAQYTVIGTQTGCPNTHTANISVYIFPGAQGLTVSGTNTICAGGSTTLTASATNTNVTSFTYSWQPGGVTSPTISVSPTSTTVYTVTATDALCGLHVGKTYTVYVNNLGSLSATSGTLCPGGTATLTASGASSYTWQPGAATGSAVAVSPSVTTTYTVSATVTGCGTTSAVATASVINAAWISSVATVTASSPYVCSGSSTTLTANMPNPTGYTYQWLMNGALISGATAQNYSTTPTDNGVYQVIITSTACGELGSASTCVDLVATECCTSVETRSNVTVSGPPLNAQNNYTCNLVGTTTIATNTYWQNCRFRMTSGAKIIVNPGVRLTLDNCQFFSCQDMWEGIQIAHNGTASGQITIMNGTTIEDAYKGVYNDCLGTTVGGTITVTSGLFNKNYKGIEISNSQAATGTYSFHPLAVSQASFTSGATTTSPGNSLKCSGYYSPTIASRGYAGIATYTVHGIVVSSGSPPTVPDNYFSKMDYGIYSNESDLLSLNSKFKTFTYTNIASFPVVPNRGVAIYGTNASPTNTNTIKVDVNNQFQDVWRAVETQNTANMRALTYTITNSAISSSLCSSGCIGNTGIYASDATAYFQANYGSITNCQNGVSAIYSSIPSYTTNPSAVSASNNTITATGSNVSTGAISFNSAGNNFTGMAANSIVAVANTISNTANGIYYNNIKNGGRISDNTVSMTYASTGTRTGIRLNGTQNCTVDNNTITCTSTSNSNLRGMWVQLSAGCHINCNTVNTVGQSFVFEGNCLSTPKGFYNNILNNANDGLVLLNSAVIGKQGSSTTGAFVSSGNQWTGTFNNSKTFTDGAASSSTTSILVIMNNTNEYPQPQSMNITAGTGLTGRDNYGTSTYNSPVSLILTAYSGYACSTPLTSGLKTAQDTAGEAFAKALQDTALYNLTVQGDSSNTEGARALEINRKYVYDLMAQGYPTNHAGLSAFYAAYQNTAVDAYSEVDSLLQSQDYAAAQSANSNATPATAIGQNQQLINSLLLNRLQNPAYAYSQSEVDALNSLATSCPLTEGNAVYQARALMCLIYAQDLQFTDNCTQTSEQGKQANMKTELPESFNLFPNPNSGSMTLAYHINRKAELKVFDVNGRELLRQSLDRNMTQVYIQANLSQGVYYYSIIGEDGQVLKADKLIIIK